MLLETKFYIIVAHTGDCENTQSSIVGLQGIIFNQII
jgi:hypothetical protein